MKVRFTVTEEEKDAFVVTREVEGEAVSDDDTWMKTSLSDAYLAAENAAAKELVAHPDAQVTIVEVDGKEHRVRP